MHYIHGLAIFIPDMNIYIQKYQQIYREVMGVQIISVDCGRNAVKAVSGTRRISLPSVVGEWRERRISEGGDYEVCIDGERYFVGELAETESRFRREMASRSKIHEETKILTLIAIALLAEPGEQLRLVTGLPVEQHTVESKQQYARLLSGNHTVIINGIKRQLALAEENIAVAIEGGGAYWAERPAGGRCYTIDAGSRTINAVAVLNNRFRDIESTTLNYGCLELENAGGSEEAAEQLARRIYADLSRLWLDTKNAPVILAGGGALLLERWLRSYWPEARVASEPVWGNALGYYALGCAKWRKQS